LISDELRVSAFAAKIHRPRCAALRRMAYCNWQAQALDCNGAKPMKPVEVAFDDRQAVLAGADFGDAYRIAVTGQNLDPVEAARRAVYGAPSWINRLLRLRTIMVKPFGLKPGMNASQDRAGPANIGMFPVLDVKPGHLVMGMNDKHLDFRLLVEVEDSGDGRQWVTASTAVRTHNLLGRVYLALVKPFHRAIVPAMLKRVSRPLP
jgi:Protein of unknown function (DUF2867)